MFGLTASPSITPEPSARGFGGDVAKRFDAGSAALWTARFSTQTALGSASSSFSDKGSTCARVQFHSIFRRHGEVRPCFAGMISCCVVLCMSRGIRAKASRYIGGVMLHSLCWI